MLQTLRRILARAAPRNWQDARDAMATARHLVLLLGCCSGGTHRSDQPGEDRGVILVRSSG